MSCQLAADGVVWAASGGDPARREPGTAVAFARLVGTARVRVLAAQANAPLIAALWLHRAPGMTIELGRPPLLDWRALARAGARDVLDALDQTAHLAPSLGGWHRMTAGEWPSYALAAAYQRRDAPDAIVRRLLASHVATRAASFIPHLDHAALGRLLAAILDPRWYRDPADPDSWSRLRCYLGLLGVGGRRSKAKQARRELVRASWKTTAAPPPATAVPGGFLWRCWLAAPTAAGADLAADVLFVDYLCETWLDALPHAGAEPLFVPAHFFGAAATAAAWLSHNAAAVAAAN